MTPEDAAMEMEALGHDFYMFLNAETNVVSVLYLRQDGHYGMLEPAK
jgi:putative sigma-54 modulation protein